jgi:hypothetical protein
MPTEGPWWCARRPLQVRLGGEATPAVVRAVPGGGAAVSRPEPRPPQGQDVAGIAFLVWCGRPGEALAPHSVGPVSGSIAH